MAESDSALWKKLQEELAALSPEEQANMKEELDSGAFGKRHSEENSQAAINRALDKTRAGQGTRTIAGMTFPSDVFVEEEN